MNKKEVEEGLQLVAAEVYRQSELLKEITNMVFDLRFRVEQIERRYDDRGVSNLISK